MSIFGGLFGMDDNEENNNNNNKSRSSDEGRLELRKEELDINKDRVQTGEVTLGKEVIEEQKSVDVPVTHEEVVIERRAIDNKPSDSSISSSADETIRIPVSEERVEVGKHTVVTGEVSAHKRDVEDTKKVEETLKREEARVDKDGNPAIVSNDSDGSFK